MHFRPFIGVSITPFITGRGPLCTNLPSGKLTNRHRKCPSFPENSIKIRSIFQPAMLVYRSVMKSAMKSRTIYCPPIDLSGWNLKFMKVWKRNISFSKAGEKGISCILQTSLADLVHKNLAFRKTYIFFVVISVNQSCHHLFGPVKV